MVSGLRARKYLLSLAFSLLLIAAILITSRFFVQHDAQMALIELEHTPPPPPAAAQATIVTAFLALGDPNSTFFAENLLLQQSELRMVLWLRDPMVVYTDEWSSTFVTETRKAAGLETLTTVINITVKELPLHSKYLLFHDAARRKQHARDADMGSQSETDSVEHSILVNSKPFFLANASVSDFLAHTPLLATMDWIQALNPYHTQFFAWLEPTYGHADPSQFPVGTQWDPTGIPAGKISLLKLTPSNDSLALHHGDAKALVSDEFIVGDTPTIDKFHRGYERRLVEELVGESGVAGVDDQAILVAMINEQPEMFHVVQGEWFNPFQLF